MIFLNKPYIKKEKNNSKLIFDFEVDEQKKSIWFEVGKEYEKYLCTERVDAILIGLLSFALREGHDIKSNEYVTEDILYKINRFLIPSLVKYGENLKHIEIDIKTKAAVKNEGAVGTGCSCGIDSMHAIITNSKTKYNTHNVTHLCINNVGAFNDCYKDAGIEQVRKKRTEISNKFAKEIGLPLIITNSNYQEIINLSHVLTHTYSSVFAILCLQKLWGKYYYGSSGMDFSQFSLKDNDKVDSAEYELLSLDCFSTKNLKIFSDGGAETRIEKTKDICDEKLVKKYLHVCTTKEYNCSKCPKCMRTILTLYSIGANLEEYSNVFDIKYFEDHKEEYFDWIYGEHCYNVELTKPIYNACLNKKEFLNYVKKQEKKKNQEIKSDNIYKEKYEEIINSKSYKLMNKLLIIPRKIIRKSKVREQ